MEGSNDGYGQDYNEDRGLGHPSRKSATPTGVATTKQPERDLQPGDPNLTGAAPAPEKKGIADKVKGLLGGHNKHHNDTSAADSHQPAVYGDATDDTGNTDTKVGCLDRIKGKGGHHHSLGSSAGSGVGHHPDSNPHGTGAGNAAGHSLDPTGPPAGTAFGEHGQYGGRHGHETQSETPYGAGAGTESYGANTDNYDNRVNTQNHGSHNYNTRSEGLGAAGYGEGRTESSPYGTGAAEKFATESHGGNTSPDLNNGTNVNSSAAVHDGWPHPTNPTGTTNGGSTLTDQHGNVHQGPGDANVKKEGFMSKIMDKLHSPKGKHSNTATDTTY